MLPAAASVLLIPKPNWQPKVHFMQILQMRSAVSGQIAVSGIKNLKKGGTTSAKNTAPHFR